MSPPVGVVKAIEDLLPGDIVFLTNEGVTEAVLVFEVLQCNHYTRTSDIPFSTVVGLDEQTVLFKVVLKSTTLVHTFPGRHVEEARERPSRGRRKSRS